MSTTQHDVTDWTDKTTAATELLELYLKQSQIHNNVTWNDLKDGNTTTT